MPDQIAITLPDGSQRALPAGSTAGELAAAIGPRLAKAAVIASVNGTERDLDWVLADGDDVAVIVEESDRGLFTLRHSTAHVLAQAVLDEFPGATFAIGPPIADGFYYDFALPGGETFTPDDLERLEARMRTIIAERQPFVRDEIPEAEALELFRDHPFKIEIIQGQADDPMSATETGLVRTYANPPRFIDLCRGPHVPHTGRLGHFKLMRVAGAYWRGRREEPDAPAHLRHGLGLQEGPQPPTSSAWSRPSDATTASWGPSSTCSPSPTRSDRAWPSSTPRAASSGGSWRTTAGCATSGPATTSSTHPTSPSRTCSRPPGTSTGSPRACSRPWSSTGAPSTTSSP